MIPLGDLESNLRQQQTALIVTKVMQRYHYKKHQLDDRMSSEILDAYIDALDANRSFFTRTDIEDFEVHRSSLDDDLKRARLDAAFEIFKVFRQRVEQRVEKALALLDEDFDFSRDETYLLDREDAAWRADQRELDELWRKRVKNDVLGLRLAEKPADEIRKTLVRRYQTIRRRTHQMAADDVFQSFLNAYTNALEPHTGYMLPRNAENFDISMRLSLEGIGAVLRSDNEYTQIQEVVPGGPADLSGQVHPGDRITGVAQGRSGLMEDVVGWRLQHVVDKIRGAKGSVVRLNIEPKAAGGASAPGVEVVIVRDKIKLEEQAAKRSIIEDIDGLNGKRIGVIEIPAFYRDFRAASTGKEDFRSTTRDVRRLLAELEKEQVDGLIIDLRDNGGGSLVEATALTGLFLDSGPVVQIRDYSGDVEVEKDPDPVQVYGGPLAVLVNRNSASASEIFSAAIQDYGRGIVLGEPTFGKGTVQQLIELGDYLNRKEDIGRLRMTIAQFYRVNGGSTQHRGVVPDILFPTVGDVDYGERSLDNALPWDQIRPASFKGWQPTTLDNLQVRHKRRIGSDSGFRYLRGQAAMFERMQDRKVISLNEAERRAEWKRREDERLSLRNDYRRSLGLESLSKASGDEDDDVLKQRREEEKVESIQLTESARILADLVTLTPYPESGLRSAQVVRAENRDGDPLELGIH
ncbi:MAG: carboxy terminal-processing peptidase [Pseudomonadota bacterium]